MVLQAGAEREERELRDPIDLSISSWKGCREGETAWILGSGPSLDELDRSRLNENVFALNLTILMGGLGESWWVCRDGRCFQKWLGSARTGAIGADRRSVHTLITDHAGTKRVEELQIGRNMIRRVVDTEMRFFTGETVLLYALQLAEFLGFAEVILAGVDLCDPGGATYAKEIDWQAKGTLDARPARFRRMRKEVAQLVSTMNARVLTTSPHLDIFEKV